MYYTPARTRKHGDTLNAHFPKIAKTGPEEDAFTYCEDQAAIDALENYIKIFESLSALDPDTDSFIFYSNDEDGANIIFFSRSEGVSQLTVNSIRPAYKNDYTFREMNTLDTSFGEYLGGFELFSDVPFKPSYFEWKMQISDPAALDYEVDLDIYMDGFQMGEWFLLIDFVPPETPMRTGVTYRFGDLFTDQGNGFWRFNMPQEVLDVSWFASYMYVELYFPNPIPDGFSLELHPVAHVRELIDPSYTLGVHNHLITGAISDNPDAPIFMNIRPWQDDLLTDFPPDVVGDPPRTERVSTYCRLGIQPKTFASSTLPVSYESIVDEDARASYRLQINPFYSEFQTYDVNSGSFLGYEYVAVIYGGMDEYIILDHDLDTVEILVDFEGDFNVFNFDVQIVERIHPENDLNNYVNGDTYVVESEIDVDKKVIRIPINRSTSTFDALRIYLPGSIMTEIFQGRLYLVGHTFAWPEDLDYVVTNQYGGQIRYQLDIRQDGAGTYMFRKASDGSAAFRIWNNRYLTGPPSSTVRAREN